MMSHEYQQAQRALREMENSRERALQSCAAFERDARDMREIRQLAREMRWDSASSLRDFCERVRRIVLSEPERLHAAARPPRADVVRLRQEQGKDHPAVRR